MTQKIGGRDHGHLVATLENPVANERNRQQREPVAQKNRGSRADLEDREKTDREHRCGHERRTEDEERGKERTRGHLILGDRTRSENDEARVGDEGGDGHGGERELELAVTGISEHATETSEDEDADDLRRDFPEEQEPEVPHETKGVAEAPRRCGCGGVGHAKRRSDALKWNGALRIGELYHPSAAGKATIPR